MTAMDLALRGTLDGLGRRPQLGRPPPLDAVRPQGLIQRGKCDAQLLLDLCCGLKNAKGGGTAERHVRPLVVTLVGLEVISPLWPRIHMTPRRLYMSSMRSRGFTVL